MGAWGSCGLRSGPGPRTARGRLVIVARMRAVVIRDFGSPQVLEPVEVPDPKPKVGEVVIDVEYASVTFVETQVRAGRAPNPRMLPDLPAVLGNGVGGTVSVIGSDVDAGLLGRRVIASLSGTGGYAERAAVAVGRLIDVPDEVTLRDATAKKYFL